MTEAKFVDLELKVHVTYSPNGVDEKTLSDILEQGLIQAVGNGLLTGDSAAEVDTWTLEILRVVVAAKAEVTASKQNNRLRPE